MKTAIIIQKIEDNLQDVIQEVDIKSTHRVTVLINTDGLVEVVKFLLFDLHFRFIIASAFQTKKGFEIMYHFSYDETGLIINLHVLLPENEPEVESLNPLTIAANWIEREIHELYGINFRNHPNLKKLISEGNWAVGEYPYRKK